MEAATGGLFLMLLMGVPTGDLASLLDVNDYFENRKIALSPKTMLDLAATEPTDTRKQLQQLLALRYLTENAATVKQSAEAAAILATVEAIAQGKKAQDPLGFAPELAADAAAALGSTTVKAHVHKLPADSVRKDALAWFPKEAKFVVALDLRSEHRQALDRKALRDLFFKIAPPKARTEIYNQLEKVGNLRLDRFALAYVPGTEKPEKGRIYMRMTGKGDVRQILELIEKTGQIKLAVTIGKTAEGTPITFVNEKDHPPAMAFVGQTEWLLAGFEHNDNANHKQVIDEMLAIRAGQAPSVLKGDLAAKLDLLSAQAAGVMVGELPAGLRRDLERGLNGVTLPTTTQTELHSQGEDYRIDMKLLYANKEDAGKLAALLTGLRAKAKAELAKAEKLPLPPELPPAFFKEVHKLLDSVKVEARGEVVQCSATLNLRMVSYAPVLFAVGSHEHQEFKTVPKTAPPTREQPKEPAPPRVKGAVAVEAEHASMFALGPMEILVLLLAGSPTGDLAALIDVRDYFQNRKLALTPVQLLALAATEPTDAKQELQQLLALRYLAENPAEVKKADNFPAILAAVEAIAQGKQAQDKLGFAKEHAANAAAALGSTTVKASSNPLPGDSVRKEALAWFPKETTLVSVLDLRQGETASTNTQLLRELLLKVIPAKARAHMYAQLERIGNLRVDRLAYAFSENPMGTQSNYFRVTGKLNRERLLALLGKGGTDKPGLTHLKTPEGITISFMEREELIPALAFVGDTDLLLVTATNASKQEEKRLLEAMLASRAGKAPSVLQGALAARIGLTSATASGIIVGDTPATAQRELERGLAPAGAPKSVLCELVRKGNDVQVDARIVFKNAADAKHLAKVILDGRDKAKAEVTAAQQRKLPVPLPPTFFKDVLKLLDSVQAEVKEETLHARGTANMQLLGYAPLLWFVYEEGGAPPNEQKPRRELDNTPKKKKTPPKSTSLRSASEQSWLAPVLEACCALSA